MATRDDTSKSGRSRSTQRKSSVTPPTEASPTATAALPPLPTTPTPPRTLKEAVAHVRALLLEVHAILHCLHEVLLYTQDDDAVIHAEVAQTAARLINESAATLDTVRYA